MIQDDDHTDGQTDVRTKAAPVGTAAAPRALWRTLVHGVFLIVLCFGVILAALAFGLLVRDTPLVAPPWLKDRIEARLDASLEGLSVDFETVALLVEDGWSPRLRPSDLRVRRIGSDARLTLSDIESTVALRPLFEGKVRPDTIYLSGAQMRLRRTANGAFDLALGKTATAAPADDTPQTGQPRVSGQVLGDLAEEIETLFDLPDLAGLRKIEANALTLRYEDGRSGRAWTVDGGRAVLDRDGDTLQLRGDFALLSGRAWATTLSVSYTSRIGEKSADFGMRFEDMAAVDLATQSAALAWLGVLEAPISGALRARINDDGQLGQLNASLQIGEGALRPTDGTPPIPFRAARSYFTFDPATQALQFDDLWIDGTYLSTRAEGKLHLIGTQLGQPSEMVGQFRMTEFSARPGDLFPEPVAFSEVRADTRLTLDPFHLQIGQLTLGRDGEVVRLSGDVRASADGWDVSATGAMAQTTPKALLSLWPKALAGKTRDWVAEFVHKAQFRDIQMGLRLTPDTRPDLYLGFDFNGAEMTLVKGLPPATNVSGHASLYRNRFVAVADTGQVAAPLGGIVSLGGTVFVVPDTKIKPAPATVQLATNGTITATLSLLDQDPFNFISKAGRSVTLADGRLQLAGELAFPLKKDRDPEDVEVNVAGVIRGLRSDVLLPGRSIAAREMQLSLRDSTLVIEGPGRIGGVPFEGRFETGIGPKASGTSRMTGWVELSERFVDEFRVGLPPGSLNGQGRATIAVEMSKAGPPDFRLSSDLAGVGLRLSAIGWSLPRAARGKFEVAGSFASPPRIDTIRIEAPGLSANGRIDLTGSGQLQTARFGRVRIGRWLEAPVVLRGRGAGRTPGVEVTGGRLDLRHVTLDGSGGGTGGGPISLTLDRLQVSDTIALSGFRGNFTTTRGMSGDFTGKVNGLADVQGQVIPQGKRSAVRIRSNDAGRVFAATKLLKQGRDGNLDLILTPVGGAGTYDGQLGVKGLRLQDAPAMAALLNAISVVGLVEQMAGRGITFSDVEARFRLTPRQLILTRSSAVGASLGVSMDGVYDFASGIMDMQGVISPIYLLNGIGSVFTRKGEGLFGFNYTLKGPAASPKVGVNPLSLLTPGMFREIFRRPPPKVPQAPTQ